MAGIDVRHLGDFIREQRDLNNISLRQLSKLAGVSNPYLSQIERGLRKPSAEILQQIAKGLRVSAEALYVQAGILEHREGGGQVADAILTDAGLNERQKQVLLEIYDSFRKENAGSAPAGTSSPGPDDVAVSVVTSSADLVADLGDAAAAQDAATAQEAAPDGPALRPTPRASRTTAPRTARTPRTPRAPRTPRSPGEATG